MMRLTEADASGPLEGDDYLDTVALLQEEVARLESELRLRDEPGASIAPEEPGGRDDGGEAEGRIAELTGLLAERDETIRLLWDQLGALEEIQSARDAEWESLHRWVREIEERVEGSAASAEGPGDPESLLAHGKARQDAWDSERRHLEGEVEGLRARLELAADSSGDTARAALEEENRRLRDECRRLACLEAASAEVAALREQLEEARRGSERAEDERRRERLEHDAQLASLRTQKAGERVAKGGDLSPNERIRALRDHLREIHDREDRERRERQLSSRLSRLWHRTKSSGQ